MRVLVTGGGGFVGRHLVAELAARGVPVDAPSSHEVDLTRVGALRALAGARYERIYHLAAWTRAGRFCQERAGEQWVTNQLINTAVIEWWQREQPGAKLVAFGTSASYAGTGVHHEEQYMAGEPPNAYYAYAMSKRMLLAGMRSSEEQFALPWLYLVPSTIYGADYHTDGRALHFVYDIARKILRARRYGDDVRLWGDGSEQRELLHVDDAVRFTLELADRTSNRIVNLCAGESHSIRKIAEELCRLVGVPFTKIRFDPCLRIGAQHKELSCRSLRELLGDHPWQVDLGRGLTELVAWAEDHLEELG